MLSLTLITDASISSNLFAYGGGGGMRAYDVGICKALRGRDASVHVNIRLKQA